MSLNTAASAALQAVWALGQMPAQALPYADLIGVDPVLPSSFAIGTAAQTSVAAAALAACELGYARGQVRQQVTVDMTHAAVECFGWFSVNGVAPDPWEKFSGLYPCADGWVRIHANFAHHRDGALQLLGLSADTAEKTMCVPRCKAGVRKTLSKPLPSAAWWCRPCAALRNGMRIRRVWQLQRNH